MIREDLVSFETAKLLKEKGFDKNTPVNYFVGDDKPRGCVVGERIYHKRAEEAALKAYPPTFSSGKPFAKRIQAESVDTHQPIRTIFIRAYEQAEKDTIERAVAWLKEHANEYIVDLTPTYPDAPVNIIVGGMCWEHLKKAMEEE